MSKKITSQYNSEQLKAYMALPAKEKFRFLEQMNTFFLKATPPKSRAGWAKLKAKGW